MGENKFDHVLQISRDLASGLELDNVCRSLVNGLMNLGLDRCAIVIGIEYDQDTLSIGERVAFTDRDAARHDTQTRVRYEMQEYPTICTFIRRHEPLLCNDVELDESLTRHERERFLGPGMLSAVIYPMVSRDRVTGFIVAERREKQGFDLQEIELVQCITGHAASAIEMTRMVTSMESWIDAQTREVTIFKALAENATYGLLMSTPAGKVTYANRANHEMFGYTFAPGRREMMGLPVTTCFTSDMAAQFEQALPGLLKGKSWQVELDGVRKDGSTFDLLMVAFSILDEQGKPLSVVCINRDITEQKLLEREREQLNQEMLSAHKQLISELSAPLIPITESILVLPLIGAIDSARAQQIMESILEGIESYKAQVVLIDVTGVPLMDTGVANHLMQMKDAAALLGARCVLVGITPKVAQTIVELGVDLSSVTTRSNLQGGVEYALRLQGRYITAI